MNAQRRKKKQPDPFTYSLFRDLPDPPPAAELVEFRNLRRPMWTEHKAKLIARYLKLFTFVTKHGTYIDGFAGEQNSKAEGGWAAELVLANEPRWLRRFYLCDMGSKQVQGLKELKVRQPAPSRGERRDIEIIHCDFNLAVNYILNNYKLDPATFCLLDQRTFECKWSTVATLANHRPDGSKIELFYFLPIFWIDRAIHATTRHPEEITAWWGGDGWKPLVDLQHHEKALAFKKRFEDLGYRYVCPFPILDHQAGDRVMFYMILATDHPEAPKLMWRAYNAGVHDEPGWDQLSLIPPQ